MQLDNSSSVHGGFSAIFDIDHNLHSVITAQKIIIGIIKRTRHIALILFGLILINNESVAQYCTPSATCINGARELQSVVFSGINNNSAGSCSGFSDFTAGTPATVTKGKSYCFSSTMTSFGGSTRMHIYMDWNADGDFIDAGELLYSQVIGSVTSMNTDIMIATTVAVTSTRMRVMINDGAISGPCASLGNFGEIEDYTVNFAADPPATTAVYQDAHGAAANDEIFYSVIQESTGGFIMAGETESMGAGGRDVYVVKTDNAGNVQWSATYGGGNDDVGRSIKQTSDGGYIIGGWSQSFGSSINFYMVKITSTGVLQWAQVHGDGGTEYGYDIIEASDGGYVMCGQKHMAGVTFDMYVIKTNSTGNLTWANAYGTGSGGGSPGQDARTVMEVGCNNYLVAGSSSDKGGKTGQSSFYVIKLSSSGGLLMGKVYQRSSGGTSTEVCYGASLTNDGGFMMAGKASGFSGGGGGTDVFIVKADKDGIVQWGKTYGGTGTDIANAMQQCKDGGFVFGGETNSYGTGTTLYMLKTDNSGTLSWAKAYTGGANDAAYSVRETSSFIMAGRTTSFGVGAKDGYVIKTDDNGDSEGGPLGCNQVSAATTVEAVTTGDISTTDLSSVGSGSTNTTITVSSSTQSSSVTGSTVVNASPGTVTSDPCLIVLPVELVAFTGKRENDRNVLYWETASETNNDFFTVERSIDGTGWEFVGTLLAAGNAHGPTQYHLTDENPHLPISYYRLKQTDRDGRYTYSGVTAIETNETGAFFISGIHPNPARDYLKFMYHGTSSQLRVEVYDQLGALVWQEQFTGLAPNSGNVLPTDALPGGIYMVRFKQNGKHQTHKMVITE